MTVTILLAVVCFHGLCMFVNVPTPPNLTSMACYYNGIALQYLAESQWRVKAWTCDQGRLA